MPIVSGPGTITMLHSLRSWTKNLTKTAMWQVFTRILPTGPFGRAQSFFHAGSVLCDYWVRICVNGRARWSITSGSRSALAIVDREHEFLTRFTCE